MKPAHLHALLCVLFLLSSPALALDGFGILSGTVSDSPNGEGIPGVIVTATSSSLLGEQTTAVTDENGYYWIPQLPPGIYTLRIQTEHFVPQTVTAIVRLNQTYRYNVELRPEDATSYPWESPFKTIFMEGDHGTGKRMDPPIFYSSHRTFQERYFQGSGVNPTLETEKEPGSTFSVDVGTSAWLLTRRALARGKLPLEGDVRVEEFLNAFDHGYESAPDAPFTVHVEGFPSPGRPGYHVLHVGVKARELPRVQRKPSHLVLTIDTSGHMGMFEKERLTLLKQALRTLVDALEEQDRVSIVTYGDSTPRLVLPPTSGLQREVLLSTIDGLRLDGTAAVEAALDLAYSVATANTLEGGVTRVVFCASGAANTGFKGTDGFWARVKDFAARGITLSTVGIGMGASRDRWMEGLSRVGGGHHAYAERLAEIRRSLVHNLTGTPQVVARGVEMRLELDPDAVVRYRLLGYEHRISNRNIYGREREESRVVGPGHTVTALYEVKLRDGEPVEALGTLRVRYKTPEDWLSREQEAALPRSSLRESYASASPRSRLAYVAAAFAEKLRASYWVRSLSWQQLIGLSEEIGAPLDRRPDVVELGALIRKAASLDTRPDRYEKVAPLATMDFDRMPAW